MYDYNIIYLKTIIQCLIMNKPVKKSILKNESSCRLVECYYCGVKKEYKDLKSHCKHVHNKPLRQKGQLTISETFFQPAKRAKTAHPIVAPETQSQPPPTPAIPNPTPDESDPLSLTEILVPEKSVDCGPRETFGTRST